MSSAQNKKQRTRAKSEKRGSRHVEIPEIPDDDKTTYQDLAVIHWKVASLRGVTAVTFLTITVSQEPEITCQHDPYDYLTS
jgi:hypothetical protein